MSDSVSNLTHLSEINISVICCELDFFCRSLNHALALSFMQENILLSPSSTLRDVYIMRL